MLSFELKQTLDNISRISFQIIDIYEKLVALEKGKKNDADYYSKKKNLIEKLYYYKVEENEEYSYFNGCDSELIDAFSLFKDCLKPGYVNVVSRKEEELIKQRIVDRLQNILMNAAEIATLSFKSKNGEVRSYPLDFETKFKNSIAIRKAGYELEEVNISSEEARRNIFIENFFYEAFINSGLEDVLIKRNFDSIPHNLSEEIKDLLVAIDDEENGQQILDDKVTVIIYGTIIIDLIAATPSLKTTELLIAFKILILYLSEIAFKELYSIVNSVPFQNLTVKLKIKQIMDAYSIEKARQNSDFNKKYNSPA